KSLYQHRIFGANNLSPVNIQAELNCSGFDLEGLPQNGELYDSALKQRTRRSKDTIVSTLGKHNMFNIFTSPLEQIILKHQRGHRFGSFQIEQFKEYLGVNVLLKQAEGSVILSL